VPYIYSMSPFGMLKTCEQWRTDVDYNHLPVRLVGRLSGLAMGYFGTSHYAVEDIAIAPDAAGWDTTLGEFLLDYDAVRASTDPRADIRAFLDSTYRACASAAAWSEDLVPVT